MSTTVKLWSFLANFWGLETSLELIKGHHIFHRSSIPCIFCSEKKLKLHILIFSPKILPENTKKSNNNNSVIYDHFQEVLELFREILANHQIFYACPTPCKSVRKSKNIWKWQFLISFSSILAGLEKSWSFP